MPQVDIILSTGRRQSSVTARCLLRRARQAARILRWRRRYTGRRYTDGERAHVVDCSGPGCCQTGDGEIVQRHTRPAVLLLTASTGAGHDSTAEALAATVRATLPGALVYVRDVLRRGARDT